MLTPERTALIIIDIQGKLAHLMYEKDLLFTNLQKLIQGAQILGIPMLVTEQNPERMGPTVPEIAHLLSGMGPISKLSFSCCGSERFLQELKSLNRNQVLIAGMEAHVCVYQTAMDLLDAGYSVQVVADAVSSRTLENKRIGLERIKEGGANWTSTEMALFELVKTAERAEFKEILQIVK